MLKRGKHEWGVGLHEGKKFRSGNFKDENFLAVRTSVYVTYSQSGKGRFAIWDVDLRTCQGKAAQGEPPLVTRMGMGSTDVCLLPDGAPLTSSQPPAPRRKQKPWDRQGKVLLTYKIQKKPVSP